MLPATPPFKIKICGVTEIDDAIAVARSGADAIGLNFFPQSKRFVDMERAHAIIDELDKVESEKDKVEGSFANEKRVQRVGVFVNDSIEAILKVAQTLRLDGIQLHGDETFEFFRSLKQQINERPRAPESKHPYTIHAIRTRPADSVEQPSQSIRSEQERVSQEVAQWGEAGVDLLLLDAALPGEFGGTGKSVDWKGTKKLQNQSAIPIVLAGGLRPSNVLEAIETSGVGAVDVASGVESSPGKKCPDLVRQFVHQAMLGLSKK